MIEEKSPHADSPTPEIRATPAEFAVAAPPATAVPIEASQSASRSLEDLSRR
jgi:hypothetical protein